MGVGILAGVGVGVGALCGGVGLVVVLVGGGVGVLVGGAEGFGVGWDDFGFGVGVGTASGVSFGCSSLVSMSAAEAKVTLRFLDVLFLGEGSEAFEACGLAAGGCATTGSASSEALRFLESLSIMDALWVFTISSTTALILHLKILILFLVVELTSVTC
jgi:hypothetical protein